VVKLIQPTLTGGELSPSLHGRVDIERYGTSVAKALNFLVRPSGGLVNRPGMVYRGASKDIGAVRLIPFIYSTTIAYVVEIGDEYMRFWANGAQITSGGNPVEVASPWTDADLREIRFTQSADVMILCHPEYAPRKLSRVSATSFTLTTLEVKEGPFKPLNTDEAIRVTSSAAVGNVTLTASSAVFSADHVGSLFYMEQKALGQVKPWTQGERNITVGTIRRSDGKTYKATKLSTGGTSWVESGPFRPVHEWGREWDGPTDQRTDGSYTWAVGVQWEYLDSGYGIVKITGYTNTTTVTGTVVRRVPENVVGGLGAAASTWNLTGDGSTKAFTISGNSSLVRSDYDVTIGGTQVQPDPYYVPPEDFYLGSLGSLF
jgi:hypothetical protein